MEISARQINDKQFHDAWRGYNQEEVDDFLDKVAEAVDALQRDNRALHARVGELDQMVATSRDTEEMLKKTLVTAQQAAEEAIASAKAKAEQLIEEAQLSARRADEEAQARVAEFEQDLRRRTMEADRAHAARRRDLEAAIERLRSTEDEIKRRLQTFLEQQLRALQSLGSGRAEAAAGDVVGGVPGAAGRGQTAPVAPPPTATGASSPADPIAVDSGDVEARMLRLPDESDALPLERKGVRGLFQRGPG